MTLIFLSCFVLPVYSQEIQQDEEQNKESTEETVVNVEAEQADESTTPGDELTEDLNAPDQMNDNSNN